MIPNSLERNDLSEFPAASLFRRFPTALDNNLIEPMLGQHLSQARFGLAPDSFHVGCGRQLKTQLKFIRRGLRELEQRHAADGLERLSECERGQPDVRARSAEGEDDQRAKLPRWLTARSHQTEPGSHGAWRCSEHCRNRPRVGSERD